MVAAKPSDLNKDNKSDDKLEMKTVDQPDITDEDVVTEDEGSEDTAPVDDRPMIVHRQPIINADGVQDVKVHTVPVEEWAEYEREHNL